jgi:hypothetical protein
MPTARPEEATIHFQKHTRDIEPLTSQVSCTGGPGCVQCIRENSEHRRSTNKSKHSFSEIHEIMSSSGHRFSHRRPKGRQDPQCSAMLTRKTQGPTIDQEEQASSSRNIRGFVRSFRSEVLSSAAQGTSRSTRKVRISTARPKTTSARGKSRGASWCARACRWQTLWEKDTCPPCMRWS